MAQSFHRMLLPLITTATIRSRGSDRGGRNALNSTTSSAPFAGPRDRRMSYDDDDDIHAFIRAREAAAGAGTSYGARGPHPRGPSNARRAAASRRALTGSDSSDGEYVPSPRKKSRGAGSSERRPPAPKALDEARAAKEDEKRRKQEERERGRKEKAAEKERQVRLSALACRHHCSWGAVGVAACWGFASEGRASFLQKAERQLGRAQKSMASAARRHEAVTVCIRWVSRCARLLCQAVHRRSPA